MGTLSPSKPSSASRLPAGYQLVRSSSPCAVELPRTLRRLSRVNENFFNSSLLRSSALLGRGPEHEALISFSVYRASVLQYQGRQGSNPRPKTLKPCR